MRLSSQPTMTFGVTFINIVPRGFMELTPFSSVLRLPIALLCWWLGMVILGLAILAFSFGKGVSATLTIIWLFRICRSKLLLLLLLEFLINFDSISIRDS
jgi:hypothetical protein